MASPFNFFRSNQRTLMVLLVILAMLAFTLEPLLSAFESNTILLGVLVGAALFAIGGSRRGLWLKAGALGAALGGLVGVVAPMIIGTPTGLSSEFAVGDYAEEQTMDLQERRAVANAFLRQASGEVYGQEILQLAPQLIPQFGFGQGNEIRDVIFGDLMRREAEQFGIAVTNGMVERFINDRTQDRLSVEQFKTARNRLQYQGRQVDDPTLFDILRDEIQAQLAYQLLQPDQGTAATPDAYWQAYGRYQTRQQINVAELDLEEFLGEVADPSEADIESYFAEWKEKFPNQDEPGSPGFYQMHKVRLAWLELGRAGVEAGLPEITDEEIQAYYEENKETQFKVPVVPELPELPGGENGDGDGDGTPETGEATGGVESAGEPVGEAPAESPNTTPEATEGGSEEAVPPTEENSAAEAGAESSSGDGDASGEDGNGAASEEDGCGFFDETTSDEGAVVADESAAADQADAAAEDEQSGATEQAEVAEEDESSNTPLAIPPVLQIPDAPAGDDTQDTPDFPEQEFEYRELDDDLKSEIRDAIISNKVAEVINEKMTAVAGLMTEMEKRRQTLRFEQRRDGADDEAAAAAVDKLSSELLAELKSYADQEGFVFVQTGLLDGNQFGDADDYPISEAQPESDNPFMRSNQPSVLQSAFGSLPLPRPDGEVSDVGVTFKPRQAVRRSFDLDGTETHYSWWITEFTMPHVPELSEEGIRDQVVRAWKLSKARPLAEKRAEELAEQVRTGLAANAAVEEPAGGDESPESDGEVESEASEASMFTLLDGVTVTGKEDSAVLPVRQSGTFQWMRAGAAPQGSFGQRQQLTADPITLGADGGDTLEKTDYRFRRELFERMEDGDIGVVPNADKSVYYVVQVINRFPTPDLGEEGIRQRFLNEGQQFAFAQSPVQQILSGAINSPANQEWVTSIWTRYGMGPDDL